MEQTVPAVLPIFLFVACSLGLAVGLLIVARLLNPGRPGRVTRMPYESGMDPIHDTRRRFDIRFHLLAIAFLVFDVELLFLYPWAVASGQQSVVSGHSATDGTKYAVRSAEHPASSTSYAVLRTSNSPPSSLLHSPHSPSYNRHLVFAGVMVFVVLLTAGFVYDWRKGIFSWR